MHPRRGVFSRVAGALSLNSPAAKPAADDSLADQWLDFLIQQADAADAAETAAAGTTADAALTIPEQDRELAINTTINRVLPSRPLHDWSSTQSPRQQ